MKYDPIDMHKKKSDSLVVHCSDPRFQSAYRKIIDELADYHDLVVIPGASKAIADSKLVVDNIKMLHGLHNFETIHILDHVECGAFGKIADEVKDHSAYVKKAKQALKNAIPNIKINAHLLHADSAIELS